MAYQGVSCSSGYEDFPMADDSELRYQCPKLGKYVFREPYWWNPIDNGTYRGRGNKQLRIDIGSENIYDFEDAYLAVDIEIKHNGIAVGPDPGYVRLANGAWNIVERARHLNNMKPIEEIYPYNLTYNKEWVLKQPADLQSNGATFAGIGTKNQREIWASEIRTYRIPIMLGWINAGPFPAKYLCEKQSIEFLMADPSQCIESNYGDLDYIVSKVELHANKLCERFPGIHNGMQHSSWEAGFAEVIRRGEYAVMFKSYDWYQNAPLVNTGDYLVPIKTRAIDKIETVFGNTLDLTNPLIDDRLLTYPKLDTVQFWIRIFDRLYPEQPVECRKEAIEAYQFYLSSVNAHALSGFPNSDPTKPDPINEQPVTVEEFNSDSFVMVTDFRSLLKTHSINPVFDTDFSRTDIRFYLRLETGTVIPPGACLYHFATSSAIIGIKDGKAYQKLN